jgi:hypothetical protein
VLFSNDQVVNLIHQHFEPAWEMVRPVPMVRIDFGDNRVVTRTLHGNIATYVCAPDGYVVDILPGIYVPMPYMNALDRVRQFAARVFPNRENAPADRHTQVQQYHRQQITNIQAAVAAMNVPIIDRGKGRLEMPVERLIAAPGINGPNGRSPNGGTPNAGTAAHQIAAQLREQDQARARAAALGRPPQGISLATWHALGEDTHLNETQRRTEIHRKFADLEPVRPEQIKNWLYKQILNADLEDPYLGLGGILFDGDLAHARRSS